MFGEQSDSMSSDKDSSSSISSDPKQDARSQRLSNKKNSENMYRKELHEIAISKCDEYTRLFSECAKREHLAVVVNCRKECDQSKFPLIS